MKMSLKKRTLTVILKTSGFYIKLCNDWDGKFKETNTEQIYPLFGFKRESKTLLLDQDTARPKERLMEGWVLTIPYVLVYFMSNVVDKITITVPEDAPIPE